MHKMIQSQGGKLNIYRRVLFVSLALNLFVGVFILIWPDAFAHLLNQPEAFPKTWPRHWGAQLIAINLLYLPGYWQPLVNRWPNWLGIAIRLSFAVFFFSQGDGFTPMGIYDGSFGLALLLAYRSATQEEGSPGEQEGRVRSPLRA
jgi:hypothetical protein